MKRLLFLFIFFLAASPVFAASQQATPVCKDSPSQKLDYNLPQICPVAKPQIKVAIPFPGLPSKTYNPVEVHVETKGDEQQFCKYQGEKKCFYVENLLDYIILLYNFFIGIIGIVAVGMIVYGSYLYLLARGNSSMMEEGKDVMTAAVSGVIIALLSWLILSTVNPMLAKLTQPIIPPVPTIESGAAVDDVGEEAAGQVSGGCPADSSVVPIQSRPGLQISPGASDPRVTPNTLRMLNAVADGLAANSSGEKIVVKSAFRSLETQKKLYDCYQKKKDTGVCPSGCGTCQQAARPNCNTAPHLSGNALDLCLGTSCGKLKSSLNGTDPDMLRLQKIMEAAGFYRFCGEWWHFESMRMSRSCTPGQY